MPIEKVGLRYASRVCLTEQHCFRPVQIASEYGFHVLLQRIGQCAHGQLTKRLGVGHHDSRSVDAGLDGANFAIASALSGSAAAAGLATTCRLGVAAFVAAVFVFVAIGSPHSLKARAPLQHRRQIAPHVRHAQARAPMVATAAGPVVPAVGATHPIIGLAVTHHQAVGQLLRVGFRPAPAHQPGAPVKKPGDVAIGPGHRRQV